MTIVKLGQVEGSGLNQHYNWNLYFSALNYNHQSYKFTNLKNLTYKPKVNHSSAIFVEFAKNLDLYSQSE